MGRRQEMLANEHRKAKEGSAMKYYYVDVRALERLGIPEYKMKSGDNFVRIISPKFSKVPPDQELPAYWKEVWVHTRIGADQKTFICMRKMKNQRCAVCELMEKMKNQDPDNESISALWPTRRYMYFIFDVRDPESESKGLHWLDAPVTFKEQTIALSKNKKTGAYLDISTRKEGLDIEFEKQGKGVGTKYVGFRLTDNGVPPQEWYDNVPEDFEEFILYPKYDTVAAEVGQLGVASRERAEKENVIRDPAPTRALSRQQTSASVPQPESEPAQASATSRAPEAEQIRDPEPIEGTRTKIRTESTQETAAAPTRTRSGENSSGGGEAISSEVRARINALKNEGGQVETR